MASRFAEAVFPEIFGAALPRIVERALDKILAFERLTDVYDRLRDGNASIIAKLLESLNVECVVSDHDLKRVPTTGPLIVVANHPFGILDGAVLSSVLGQIRGDVKILANRVLSTIPELRELLIDVDVSGHRTNRRGVTQAIAHLENGGALIVFPAGEVSHFQWRKRAVADRRWTPRAARIATLAVERGADLTIVPAFITGTNSLMFHAAGVVHRQARTALLVRELLNKRNERVEVRVGAPVSSRKLLDLGTDRERIEYLQWRSRLLKMRPGYRTNTRVPVHGVKSEGVTPVAVQGDQARLADEVERLAPDAMLGASGELAVYLASAKQIPAVLQEIGRLREVTFRAAGEGTGKAVDLDHFDDEYLHLFVWNHTRGEVVGAYRIAQSDCIRNLYTATLFHFKPEFRRALGPALELGRSFVRVEYQRAFAPLLLLWKGIGKFVARHPQYKILFGSVSISNQYSAASREVMISFLERYASLAGLRDFVRPRHRIRAGATVPAGLEVDDLSTAVADLESAEVGIPVLLRQYLKLGGKLLAFSVDHKFANALDGLIVVDLTQTEPKLLERYLGKEEAAQFLAYQKGTNESKSNVAHRELVFAHRRGGDSVSDTILQVQRSA